MNSKRRFLKAIAGGLMIAAVSASAAVAHHGWRWAEDGEFVITGTIAEARLGNPHGLVTLNVNNEMWTIEVGQPWRNERAGLTDDMFAEGTELTARGHRSRDATDRRVKAERLIIAGSTYDLYPTRD